MAYLLAQGEALVKAARYTIDLYLKSPKFERSLIEKMLDGFEENQGVFVTLEHYPTMALRGCIGFPFPSGHIKKRLVDAAIAAATEDPRFVPVAVNELEEIVVEVNVLSPPKLVEKSAPDDRKRAVRIGRDGLMIQYGFRSGLLLPEVAIEHKWNKDEFLDSICEKAGLPKGTWKRPEVNLYTFTSQIFKETYPEGQVKEVFLE
ncbi:MAG: TIGR00296 family protein [Candidatus Micrarchaeota archaeon]|nr:TIGR00296 family protein [Candidatus Micrarchaeota archaeon]MDE1859723.1 TIGR00296 family protein [Candidatus Micrarchaeota archaeon]